MPGRRHHLGAYEAIPHLRSRVHGLHVAVQALLIKTLTTALAEDHFTSIEGLLLGRAIKPRLLRIEGGAFFSKDLLAIFGMKGKTVLGKS